MRPSFQDRWSPPLLPALAFIALGVVACLMPVHNDTWWHLRTGYETLRDRAPLFVDRFSYTAYGQFFWNHSWIVQSLFYLLFSLGGLPLLTGFCAALTVAAWVMVWRQMRGPLDLRILLFALACSASTTIWSVRPQVFSMVLLPIVVVLTARDRLCWIPPIVALWANLHAGVAVAVVVVAASSAAAVIQDRDRFVRRVACLMATVAATLLTPLGVTNWTETVASMARSRANRIQEWQMTPLPPEQLVFWGVATFFVWQIARGWRRLHTPEDRVFVVAAMLMLPLAVRTFRTVPAFMMLAAPALTRLAQHASPRPTSHEPRDSGARTGPRRATIHWGLTIAVALGLAIVCRAWAMRWDMLGWQPISPEARVAVANCRPNLYNTYAGGGALIWFVPEEPVFIDSRQDQYPVLLIQAASRVEATGDYRALFAHWSINCAALPPKSPTVAALRRDGWHERFRDESWVVLDRP